jgi:zinc-ribbon domain
MYCPKCATQNSDDTKYCRACGSNLSLVPQALTGQLPTQSRHRRKDFERGGPANLANGISKLFMGAGFLLVSFACFFFAPAGRIWWFWMLIPAFAMLGKGIAEIVSAKFTPNQPHGFTQQVAPPATPTGELRPSNEVYFPPGSVTEQTTRHLDPSTDPQRYQNTNKH